MPDINASVRACLQRPIAYHRIFAKIGGSITAGLLLSQLFYWSDKGSGGDGWIYKTQNDIEEETGMSRWEQESARKLLREKGLVEETKRGLPAKLFYRVNISALMEAIQKIAEGPANKDAGKPHAQGRGKTTYKDKQQTSERKNLEQGCGKTSNKLAEKPHSFKGAETTTEITTETTTTKTPAPEPSQNLRSDVVVFDSNSIPDSTARLLIENGITEVTAHSLAEHHDAEVIKRQIAALAHRKAIDPAATLIRSIQQDWSLPKRMIEQANTERNKQKIRQKHIETNQKRESETAQIQALEEAWKRLEYFQRAEIEKKALENILARPMGARLLEGAVGAEMLRKRCLELLENSTTEG